MSIYERQHELNLDIPDSVAVVGCGGVGSWVGLFFALVGVKKIVLVDDDVIEEHNLNRTPYCSYMLDLPKVEALKLLIEERRPECEVETIEKKLSVSEMEELSKKVEVLIDCRDTVDSATELSKVVGGYNGEEVTIEVNPQMSKHWGSGLPIRYTVPSYVVPPVFIASIIVDVVLHRKEFNEHRLVTDKVKNIIKNIVKEVE